MIERGPVHLGALGIVSALGRGKHEVLANLMSGGRPNMVRRHDLLVGGAPVYVGEVAGELPGVPASLTPFDCRNLRLAVAATEEIRDDIETARSRFGVERIAVVMGTSTSGIAEGEAAVSASEAEGRLPGEFDMLRQETGSVGESLARYLELSGPALSISTACSSSAHALAVGRRLLRTGLADAVITGGADSLCRLTVNGFQALSALSAGICNPMSRNRDGTSIGEGSAVFLMQREAAEIALFGAGSSTEAYSMTAPEPEGEGVEAAIRRALDDAGMTPSDIDYIQLHGTGTPQNDKMESKVVKRLFGGELPCSSSKGQLGHTLGAAGAMAAAHCWLAAWGGNASGGLPPHVWDGEADGDLLCESLVAAGDRLAPVARRRFLANSFAFGGNNVSLLIGRAA